MAVIIEIRRRGGQLIERCRCDAGSIRVGRSYDNDVIVDDPFVSPHHVRLDPCENGWKVVDLESLNGYRIKTNGKTADRDVIYSGEKMRLGHVTLRIYHTHHAVAPALKVNGLESGLKILGWHRVWPFALMALLGSSLLELYFRSVAELELMDLLSAALDELVTVGSIALLWALAGRVFRHQPRFFSHFSMWSIYAILTQMSDSFAGFLAYNFGSDNAKLVVDTALQVILLALVVWSSLSLASNLRARGRFWSAVSASLVFLSLQFVDLWQFEQFFVGSPEYQSGLKPPALTWVGSSSPEQLIEFADELFDEAEQSAKEPVE